jgi:glycosyl transferase family 25
MNTYFLILVILLFIFLINLRRNSIEPLLNFSYPELFFINLKDRPDRLTEITNELNKINYPKEKITRVDAIKKEDGALGCGLSHIKALEMGLKSNDDFIIILEDDFMFNYSKEKSRSIIQNSLSNSNWNMILFSCNGKSEPYSDCLRKVTDCQTTSGYVIKKNYIPVLINEWKKNMNLREKYKFEKKTSFYKNTTIDICWKKYQHDKWFITNPKLGKQRPSFSSIENKYVIYNI